MSKITDNEIKALINDLKCDLRMVDIVAPSRLQQMLESLLASREDLKKEREGNTILENENNKLSKRVGELEEFIDTVNHDIYLNYEHLDDVEMSALALTPKEEV